jgi:vacuolar protein sorting-associated protein 13D
MSFGTSLITNIVENLQLNIKDVHIRYEDSITIPSNPFCCGVTIDSLTAQSCDVNWMPGFTSNWSQNEATFKLIELNSLSFYLDPIEKSDEDVSCIECDSNELAEAMNKFKSNTQHQYIIKPVSAQAKFKRDRSEIPLRTRSRPRLTCNLFWNEIYLSVKETQYNAIVSGVNGLSHIAKRKQYRLLQPRVSVKEDCRAWWIFGAQCQGFFRNKNKKNVAKNNIRYIKICKRLIENPNEILTQDDKEFKESIEKERDIDDLRELREICMHLLPSPNEAAKGENNNQGRTMLLHYFPGWWGWYGQNNNNSSVSSSNSSTSAGTPSLDPQSSFEDELLNVLNDTVESNSILKRDAVFGKFQFMLKKGTLDVFQESPIEGTKKSVMFHFEELTVNVESRPRSGSHFISLSLGSINVKAFSHQTPNSPTSLSPKRETKCS